MGASLACCSEISKSGMDGTGRPADAGVPSVLPALLHSHSAFSGAPCHAKSVSASTLCPPPHEEDVKRLISTVGELPTFASPSRHCDDNGSEAGSQAESVGGISEMCDEMDNKEKRRQGKAVVKAFVKEMVRGKKINVIKPNGEILPCTVSLSRTLGTLKIKAGVHVGSQGWLIKLSDVAEIAAGTDLQHSSGVVDTPLDELCATLVLKSGDRSVTLQMADLNARDTFILCILMFITHQNE